MEITATAHRWERGWELAIDGDTVTQVATLDRAAQQVRDYLDTIEPETDHAAWRIAVIPDIGDLGADVTAARAATAQAGEAAIAAAARSRQVARRLRDAGYSVTDAAAILGVSRGRVSQLVNG